MIDKTHSPERPLWRSAVVTVPAILALGILSGRASGSGYGNPWFDRLVKPEFMPPGWMFGAAWTTLYILLGLALALILRARGGRGRSMALALFGAQMLLNLAWSPLFFAMHQILPALLTIIAMLGLSIAAAFLFARISKPAAWLMIPYLAWLSFASLLTWRILQLNPGA